MARTKKPLRTFVLRSDNQLHVYFREEKPKVVVTSFEVQAADGRELASDQELCADAFNFPGLKDLKEGELVEVVGLQLRSE